MNTIVYIACSLDGNIARDDGKIDWLMDIPNPDNNDYGFLEFMESIDAILMGRNTFETVLTFEEWPYTKKVYVYSNNLKEIPKHLNGKIEIIFGNPRKIIRELELLGIKKLYVDGGKTIQTFLEEDLIDEMVITTITKIIGNGTKLFSNITKDLLFEITKSEILSQSMLKNHYKRNRTTAST